MKSSDAAVQTSASLRVTIVLWLLVLVSGVSVIYTTHVSRNAFVESQTLHQLSQNYDVEWGRLLIERSNSSSITRLENIASSQLHMQVPDAKRVVVLKGEE